MANEKRLISLDNALKATHSEIYWTESQQAAVRSFLVKQPKVDAVEVVRCKDCWKSGEGLCSYQLKNVPGKDFCGDGERIEGE